VPLARGADAPEVGPVLDAAAAAAAAALPVAMAPEKWLARPAAAELAPSSGSRSRTGLALKWHTQRPFRPVSVSAS